jgi:hypothetical protein
MKFAILATVLCWTRNDGSRAIFDIIDKYSPGARPNTIDLYTHKLNLELDTAVPFLKWSRRQIRKHDLPRQREPLGIFPGVRFPIAPLGR